MNLNEFLQVLNHHMKQIDDCVKMNQKLELLELLEKMKGAHLKAIIRRINSQLPPTSQKLKMSLSKTQSKNEIFKHFMPNDLTLIEIPPPRIDLSKTTEVIEYIKDKKRTKSDLVNLAKQIREEKNNSKLFRLNSKQDVILKSLLDYFENPSVISELCGKRKFDYISQKASSGTENTSRKKSESCECSPNNQLVDFLQIPKCIISILVAKIFQTVDIYYQACIHFNYHLEFENKLLVY